MDRVEDYILLTGEGLGKVIDQIVESCHSGLNKRLVSSEYHPKKSGYNVKWVNIDWA